jgi:SAM-dependent methyltransferase
VKETPNLDAATVEGFGQEWSTFNQAALSDAERNEIFHQYFSLINWSERPKRALDMGCGSGRWDLLAAPLVDELVAADASHVALDVARRNIQHANVSFVECSPESLPFPDGHFDLIFSLGVLHHVPNTQSAISSLAAKLAPGGSLLLYLYYAFDNRPFWFRAVWKISDIARQMISRLPFPLRLLATQGIALCVYWPLARTAKYLPVPSAWPLKFYARRSYYVMRTDALDRFGTRVEKRFTREEINTMLKAAGFENIRFSPSAPYWVCVATRS